MPNETEISDDQDEEKDEEQSGLPKIVGKGAESIKVKSIAL